jgi:hypothetical protein
MVFDIMAKPARDSTQAPAADLHIGSGIFKTIDEIGCADGNSMPGAEKHQYRYGSRQERIWIYGFYSVRS